MGYDCTLHAVDEKDVKGKFVRALLTGTKPPRGFTDDDQELWSEMLKSLAEDSPADAASSVCQVALIFASKFRPSQYERGFALCLWPKQPDGLDATFPQELTDSPELLLGELTEKYPRLRGQFPSKFSGNWSTGTFISAKKVPQALQWIEDKVSKYAEGDQRLFHGLRLVLQHCARNQLAYWEGTDLPIAAAGISLEGAEQRRAERSFKWPDYGYVPIARQGCLFVGEYYLGRVKSRELRLPTFPSGHLPSSGCLNLPSTRIFPQPASWSLSRLNRGNTSTPSACEPAPRPRRKLNGWTWPTPAPSVKTDTARVAFWVNKS